MFATQRSIVYKVSIMFLFRKMQILSNRRLNEPFHSALLVGTSSAELEKMRVLSKKGLNEPFHFVLIHRCFPGYTGEDSSILEPVIE